MAITYPIEMPSYTEIRKATRIEYSPIDLTAVSKSPVTLKAQVHASLAQQWRVSVTFTDLSRVEAGPWLAFLRKLYGNEGTFWFRDFLFATPLGSAGGKPVVNGNNQTGRTLSTRGWPIGKTVLKAGSDMIQIDNALYMITQDAVSNGNGIASLEIWPALRGHADGTTIRTQNPGCLMRLVSNESGWSEPSDGEFSFGFAAEEAL